MNLRRARTSLVAERLPVPTAGVWLLIASCLLALVVSGCGRKQGGDEDSTAFEAAVEKTYDRGPVTLVLRLDNDAPTIADTITLQIEVTSDEAYEVTPPAFGEKLEQFGIVDFRTSPVELVGDGKVRETRTYLLEPFLSGDYLIPPMTYRFTKRDGEDKEHVLETEELTVTVSSLRGEEAANLDIHEIAPPVELPKKPIPWEWIRIASASLAVLAGLFGWLLARRKKRFPPPARQVPAHEIAFADLEKLVADDLPGRGEIKQFYQRISDILRHYIENRFGLHAPDRTTEEFLGEVGSGTALESAHQPLLARFLEHCDLVKFAEHQPGTSDIQDTFDSCKNFILETKDPAPAGAS